MPKGQFFEITPVDRRPGEVFLATIDIQNLKTLKSLYQDAPISPESCADLAFYILLLGKRLEELSPSNEKEKKKIHGLIKKIRGTVAKNAFKASEYLRKIQQWQ